MSKFEANNRILLIRGFLVTQPEHRYSPSVSVIPYTTLW